MKPKVNVAVSGIEYRIPFYEFLGEIQQLMSRARVDGKYAPIGERSLNKRGSKVVEGLETMLSGMLTAEEGNIAYRLSKEEIRAEASGNPLYFHNVVIRMEIDKLYFDIVGPDGRTMRGSESRIRKLPTPEESGDDLYDDI